MCPLNQFHRTLGHYALCTLFIDAGQVLALIVERA